MTVNVKDLAYAAVLCATVSGEDGRRFKRRSLVVLTPTVELKQDGKLVLACITTQFTDDWKYVQVPHHTRGHHATGLTAPSAVACHWLRELDPFDLDEINGFMPESYMEQIVARVRRLNNATLSDAKKPIVAGTVRPKGQTPRG